MSNLLDEFGDNIAPLIASGSARFCVALSGGLDSSVLLHLFSRLRDANSDVSLRAIHINHQLQVDAVCWAKHCENFCSTLEVRLHVECVTVDETGGTGPEASARAARYGVFRNFLEPGEYLVTAHHQEDQLETVFLHLLRGSGVHGLSGIPATARFAEGYLIRPLLGVPRAELIHYARDNQLSWVEDPSNTDVDMDRNYLRHTIVPKLQVRWPGAARTVGRSAQLASEAAALLDVLADIDARGIVAGETINLAGLTGLDFSRQCNLVRRCLRRFGMSVPSQTRLVEGLRQLQDAREDRHPVLKWAGGQIRRYRGVLYVLRYDPYSDDGQGDREYLWNTGAVLDMGVINGCLSVEHTPGRVEAGRVDRDLQVRFRCGGERIRLPGQEHSKTLKQFFQEHGVVTWMRGHVPLIYAGDQLIAVADLWSLEDADSSPGRRGLQFIWSGHPDTGVRQPNEFARPQAGG